MVSGARADAPPNLPEVVAQLSAAAAEFGLQLLSIRLSGAAGPRPAVTVQYAFDATAHRSAAGSRKRRREAIGAMPTGGEGQDMTTSTVDAAGGPPALRGNPLMAMLCNERESATLASDGRGVVAEDPVDMGQQMVELPGLDDVVEFCRDMVDKPNVAKGELTTGHEMGRSRGLQKETSRGLTPRESQEEQRRAATERREDYAPEWRPAMDGMDR